MRWLAVFALAVALGASVGGCIFPYDDGWHRGGGHRHHHGGRR